LGAGSDKFGGKYWGGIYGSLIFKTGIYSSFTLTIFAIPCFSEDRGWIFAPSYSHRSLNSHSSTKRPTQDREARRVDLGTF
jgi:hypothetical protein